MRQRTDGWFWAEHELFSVFAPLIGPSGIAVYAAYVRLVGLVPLNPYRWDFDVRSISDFAGVSRSVVAEQKKLLLELGMVIETKYLDGRKPTYQLPSLRDLAKVGTAELKQRAGVRQADNMPFDFKERNEAQRVKAAQKRREKAISEREYPLLESPVSGGDVVRHADNQPEAVLPVEDDPPRTTLSAEDVMSSARNVKLSATRTTSIEEERERKTGRQNPLPPASQGDVGNDPDAASPSLPALGVVYGDAGFPQSLPTAVSWVTLQLGISQSRLQPLVSEQLELWCKRNRGATLEAAAMRMEQQGRMLHEHADRLRHRPWGWRRFIGEGHWTRPLPYAPGYEPRTPVLQQEPPATDARIVKLSDIPADSAAEQAWRRIQEFLSKRLNVQSFTTWLRPTRGLRLDAGVLTVLIPSAVFSHIADRYKDLIKEALTELGLDIQRVELALPETHDT